MAEEKVQPGDIVKLRSGGPLMTAQYYTSGGTVKCSWFNETELKSGDFNPNSLDIQERLKK